MNIKFKPNNLKVAVVSAIVLGSVGFSTAIFAEGSATDDLIVQASVGISCTIEVNDIDFEDYDPTSSSDDTAQGSVISRCTTGGNVVMTLGQGSGRQAGTINGSSTDATPVREMTGVSGAAMNTKLAYGLFQDSGHGTVFGGTAQTGKAIDYSGSAHTTTIYGKIPALQTAALGSYIDSVPVTLTY